MYLGTKFKNLNFGSIKNSKREEIQKDTWNFGRVGMGVAHIHDIKYEKDLNGLLSVCGGQVDLYVDMFKALKDKIWTHHFVLMEKLGMWERFTKFKQRVVDKDGEPIRNVDIKKEKEIWFGFTRKAPGPWDRKKKIFDWSSVSCTLNSWIWDDFFNDNINFLTGALMRREAAPKVVSKAGIKKTDTKEAALINIIPPNLWYFILHELHKMTPGDASNFPVWHYTLISDKDNTAKAMKSLVLKATRGSMIYEVDAGARGLGKSENGFELFCEVLIELMEDEKMREEDQFQLKILKLYLNCLKDTHLETLFKLVKKCPKLEKLWLIGNEFTRKGCWKIVRWCRDYKLDIILYGNEGWSEGLHKYQRRLVPSPWMNETPESNLLVNWYLLTLKRYPSYALNENLAVPDMVQLFGIPSLSQAKYLHDSFFPASAIVAREMGLNEDEEKVSRPELIKVMIKGRAIFENLGFELDYGQLTEIIIPQLISNPDISSSLKQVMADVVAKDVVANLGNPEFRNQITGSLNENAGLLNESAVNLLGNLLTSTLTVDNDELKID